MTLEHRSYSHAIEPRGPSYWISRMLFLIVVGYLGMILSYSTLLTAFSSSAPAGKPSAEIGGGEVVRVVATEAVRTSLSPWWKNAPWPDGAIVARLQARLVGVDALMLHSLVGALTFSVLGFIAGRMMLANSVLLLPICLFFATFGFLKSDLLPLLPLKPLSVAIIVAVQIACAYGFALWGKWSYRG